MAAENYPVTLSVDYPERLDKLTTFFRIFTVIPIWILLVLLMGGHAPGWRENWNLYLGGGAGVIFLPTLLMILFRQKYPRWWFDWNLALTQFGARVTAYLLLLRDEYPSTDSQQAVHLEIAYPDVKRELKRAMPLVKWFLAIPHLIALAFLGIAVVVCVVISWFAILFTGTYPMGLFDFVVGVMRWELRVFAYAFLLTTDQYPPFRLSE